MHVVCRLYSTEIHVYSPVLHIHYYVYDTDTQLRYTSPNFYEMAFMIVRKAEQFL